MTDKQMATPEEQAPIIPPSRAHGYEKPVWRVCNQNKGTAWKVGATVHRISEWENGFALFTDAENPGVSIHAHINEVVEIL